MKLQYAQSITSTVHHEHADIRRGDTINPLTGELPAWAGTGPLDEVIRRELYDGTETLTIEDAATDMIDQDHIHHNGREYRITEKRESRQYGFWDYIKCTRNLIDGI